MKNKIALVVAALALAASVTTSQAVLSLNFNSVTNSTIQFNGLASSFQLNPAPGSPGSPQFVISSESGGAGTSSVGLFGWVNGGPWSIGAITQTIISGHTLQTANVTGSGALTIRDALGVNLTGTISWVTIGTLDFSGGINAQLAINLTGITYSGVNADLLTLAAGHSGSLNVSFQFAPGLMLSQLTTTSVTNSTSFAGSVTSVPEPSTVVAGALLLLPFGVSTLRILRKNRIS